MYDAKEEIKRADHLIFVSLKYTRTVDMFRHIIRRMINALEFTIDELLEYAKKKKKTKEIPASPVMKGEAIKELFLEEKEVGEMVDLYLFFRRLMREKKYDKAREYRRHVTMTTIINEDVVEINIDKIHEYFDKIREYIEHVEKIISGKDE